jgi:hypothetical protein
MLTLHVRRLHFGVIRGFCASREPDSAISPKDQRQLRNAASSCLDSPMSSVPPDQPGILSDGLSVAIHASATTSSSHPQSSHSAQLRSASRCASPHWPSHFRGIPNFAKSHTSFPMQSEFRAAG